MNSFYPRRNWTDTPPGAQDHTIPVGPDVSLSARLFPADVGTASILYFYGNGETAADYDDIALWYNSVGVNFFVVDYRGYGNSGGSPAFSTMLSDAWQALDYLEKYAQRRRVPGRPVCHGPLHGPPRRLRAGRRLAR